MGMAAPVHFTADMVRALPDDGNRYETVHGELLVTPAPRPLHQLVLERLRGRLWAYLEKHPVGVLLSAPADISWGPDILVQPDLFVVPLEEARTLDWTHMQHLLLVAEVPSPTTARYDRVTKRRLYQEVHIPCYWIVNPDERAVEIWTPGATSPLIERERVVWTSADPHPPLTIDLEGMFRPL